MHDDEVPTEQLLERVALGERAAVEALYQRYLPRLRRWAAGRLPAAARDLSDTHDLVQETLMQAFRHISSFEYRGEGAFLAYLRRCVVNRINGELRRVVRRPAADPLGTDHKAEQPSPLELVLGQDALERYERGLEALSESDRQAIIARIEFRCEYDEVAAMLGQHNAAAARKTVERALRRLAVKMGHER